MLAELSVIDGSAVTFICDCEVEELSAAAVMEFALEFASNSPTEAVSEADPVFIVAPDTVTFGLSFMVSYAQLLLVAMPPITVVWETVFVATSLLLALRVTVLEEFAPPFSVLPGPTETDVLGFPPKEHELGASIHAFAVEPSVFPPTEIRPAVDPMSFATGIVLLEVASNVTLPATPFGLWRVTLLPV
jgi:hypothetical protein